MENSQQHLGDTGTSAFTLPTPTRKQLKQRKLQQRQKLQQQREEQEQRQRQHGGDDTAAASTPTTAAAPLHSTNSHEEFSSAGPESDQSPSLPWLVEYWSSSLTRLPEVVFDRMLCSCASTSMQFHDSDNSRHHNSIVSNNSYFDDTIVKSDPANVVRSPTKISSTRWEALRAVVASHSDYTMQDYCDFYESTVPVPEDGTSFPRSTTQQTSADSKHNPTKPTADWSKCRESSILAADDESMDEDDDFDVTDDDIRMEPPASPATQEEDNDLDAFRDLYTCHSFDQYIDTTSRYLCAQQQEQRQRVPATPPPATPPRVPPANRLPDRRRSRQASAAIATTLSPRTLGFQRLQPPSPSTDTYTTISLSQSFAREFDDDDDSSEHMVERCRSPSTPATPPSLFRQKRNEDNNGLFLDRIAAETISDSSSQSPFRRLRPRTRSTGIEDEKKEEEENLGETKINNENITDHPSTPPRKKSTDEDEEDVSAYRYLVRMSPDNYRHASSYDDWLNTTEEMARAVSVASSASSSVLLPLHPHQRIMDFDSRNGNGSSGYTCFRHDLDKQQQQQQSQLQRVSTPVECS